MVMEFLESSEVNYSLTGWDPISSKGQLGSLTSNKVLNFVNISGT
jgi:hypothetical protein